MYEKPRLWRVGTLRELTRYERLDDIEPTRSTGETRNGVALKSEMAVVTAMYPSNVPVETPRTGHN
jgi:hypothetical protein